LGSLKAAEREIKKKLDATRHSRGRRPKEREKSERKGRSRDHDGYGDDRKLFK